MAKKQKINTSKNPLAKRIKGGETVNKIPSDSGIGGTSVKDNAVSYKASKSEICYPSRTATAQITFGNDRFGGPFDGFGGIGAQRSAKIDMVVGRMASSRGGKGPKQGTSVDNSFTADAARIYISQLTDVDKNFGIAKGRGGIMKNRSSIGIKADGVRIIGREGIKIVTGKAQGAKGFGPKGETNSRGGKIVRPAPPIELIAGNNSGSKNIWGGLFNPQERYDYLQPITMGKNTRDAFMELSGIIDEIWSALFSFAKIQGRVNSKIGTAMITRGPHRSAARIVAGAACGRSKLGIKLRVKNSLKQTRNNKFAWEVNYLRPFGPKYICSRNVFST